MKAIGVISDTHIPTRASAIPEKVFQVFKGLSLIVHAGDLVQFSVLRDLEEVAPVVAVHGNMDERSIKERMPSTSSVAIYGWKIGVIHNVGGLLGTGRMKRIAKQKGFNVLVFGHIHRPFLKQEDGVLFINPGSPTNPLPPLLTKPTVALLKITKERIEPKIVRI